MKISKEREFKLVRAGNIHPSSLLPQREHNDELANSVKEMGIQQPLIVRTLAGKPEEYEDIDGDGRRKLLKDDQEVHVDVRYDVDDSTVFRISHATFQRKDRSAYDTARFCAAWLRTLEHDKGASEGLQQLLAKQAGLSESAVSQYLSISGLFEKLKVLAPDEEFSKLKTWSVNKLYKLSELVDHNLLINVAKVFELKFETSLEEVEETVDQLRGPDPILDSLDDEKQTPTKSELSPQTSEQPVTPTESEPKNICLGAAQKVCTLAAETHNELDKIVKELVDDIDKFPQNEILQTLNTVLRTLQKLRKQYSVLQQKMKTPKIQGVPQ